MGTSLLNFLQAPTNVGAFLLASLLAAAIAAWGVATQRVIARRRATLDHISKIERDSDVIAATQTFIKLSNTPEGLAPWAEKDREATPEVQAIKIVLNDFELVSIGIQRGIIDYELYRLWFKTGTVKYWEYASPFVAKIRDRTGNKMLYHEFQELARWMNDESKPKRNRFLGKWI